MISFTLLRTDTSWGGKEAAFTIGSMAQYECINYVCVYVFITILWIIRSGLVLAQPILNLPEVCTYKSYYFSDVWFLL